MDEVHWRELLRASRLCRSLANGDPPLEDPNADLSFGPGEPVRVAANMEYTRFYAVNTTYRHQRVWAHGSPAFVLSALAINGIGNAAARSRALRLGAATWRDAALVRAFLKDRRLVVWNGFRWLEFPHASTTTFAPDPARFSLVIGYSNCEPVRMRGQCAPLMCVCLAWLFYGPEAMRALPAFRSLADLTQDETPQP